MFKLYLLKVINHLKSDRFLNCKSTVYFLCLINFLCHFCLNCHYFNYKNDLPNHVYIKHFFCISLNQNKKVDIPETSFVLVKL